MANKAKISASIIAAAFVIVAPFLSSQEGNKLESYEDVVGVWTICKGVTQGIKPGMKKTDAECDALSEQTQKDFMSKVAASLTIIPSPALLAAHTSFAYNIGIGGYRSSRTLRETNTGNLEAGCRAMSNWYRAGGKDCRIRKNNCYGVIVRREAEINLCIAGSKL